MTCNGVLTSPAKIPPQIGNPPSPKFFYPLALPPPVLKLFTLPPPPPSSDWKQKHVNVKLMHKPLIQHNS